MDLGKASTSVAEGILTSDAEFERRLDWDALPLEDVETPAVEIQRVQHTTCFYDKQQATSTIFQCPEKVACSILCCTLSK